MTDSTSTTKPTYSPFVALELCIELVQQFIINNNDELGPRLERDLIAAIRKVYDAYAKCNQCPWIIKGFTHDVTGLNQRDRDAFEYVFEELLFFTVVTAYPSENKINIQFVQDPSTTADPEPTSKQDTSEQDTSAPASTSEQDTSVSIPTDKKEEPVSETSLQEEHAVEPPNLLKIYANKVKLFNDELLEICRTGGTADAKSLFASDGSKIDTRYQDYEALKTCIKMGNIHMLELLAGPNYLGWSRDLINEEASKLAIQAAYNNDMIMVSRCLLFTRSDTHIMRRIITIACRDGRAGTLAIVLDKGVISPDYHSNLCYAIAASMTSGNRELIHACLTQYAKVVGTNYGIISTGVTEELNRGILIEAAKTGDPELFEHVLKTIDCYFNKDPRWVHKYASFEHLDLVIKSGAVEKLLEICCNQPNSRLVDALVAKVGEAIPIDTKQLSWFDAACRNGHDSVISLFLAEPLTDPQEWISICVDQNLMFASNKIIEKYRGSLSIFGPTLLCQTMRKAMIHFHKTRIYYA